MTTARLRAKPNLPIILSSTYFGIAVILLSFFLKEPDIPLIWQVLYVITLPWSIVSPLLWGAFPVGVLIFAVLNAWIIYRLIKTMVQKKSTEGV